MVTVRIPVIRFNAKNKCKVKLQGEFTSFVLDLKRQRNGISVTLSILKCYGGEVYYDTGRLPVLIEGEVIAEEEVASLLFALGKLTASSRYLTVIGISEVSDISKYVATSTIQYLLTEHADCLEYLEQSIPSPLPYSGAVVNLIS